MSFLRTVFYLSSSLIEFCEILEGKDNIRRRILRLFFSAFIVYREEQTFSGS